MTMIAHAHLIKNALAVMNEAIGHSKAKGNKQRLTEGDENDTYRADI